MDDLENTPIIEHNWQEADLYSLLTSVYTTIPDYTPTSTQEKETLGMLKN